MFYAAFSDGRFQGIPATGEKVAVASYLEECIVDGRVVEYSSLFDSMGMTQQLGVMPAPPPRERAPDPG